MSNYPVNETALLLVDPLNEFLSEGGKLWDFTKTTAQATRTVENLKMLVETCRDKGVLVVYTLHHAYCDGDYDNWKFLNPSHQGGVLRIFRLKKT